MADTPSKQRSGGAGAAPSPAKQGSGDLPWGGGEGGGLKSKGKKKRGGGKKFGAVLRAACRVLRAACLRAALRALCCGCG